jgi:hypothetical protein
MTGARIAVVALAGTVAMAPIGALVRPAAANGVTQREIHGRVVSVDAASGTLVVAREFRGKTTQVTLKAAAAMRVFSCAEAHASLERVKKGMTVSAFYEVVGADGVVNLIVVEPGP